MRQCTEVGLDYRLSSTFDVWFDKANMLVEAGPHLGDCWHLVAMISISTFIHTNLNPLSHNLPLLRRSQLVTPRTYSLSSSCHIRMILRLSHVLATVRFEFSILSIVDAPLC